MTDTITTPAEALEAAARKIVAEVQETKRTHTRNAGTDYHCREFFVDHGDQLLVALSARIAEPVTVVKPLEWSKETDPNSYAVGCITARPEAGFRYIAQEMYRGGWKLTGSVPFYLPPFPTLEAAKAAAQANYEARLLSGITIQPAAQAQSEAVAGAMRAAYEGLFKHANGTTVLGGQNYRSITLEVAAELLISITPKEAFAELDRVHNLAVAGAYMAALKGADTFLQNWVDRDWSEEMERAALNTASGISDRILALTPADAAAALAQRDAEVRRAALREVLEEVRKLTDVPRHILWNDSYKAGCTDAQATILTLIEEPAHG